MERIANVRELMASWIINSLKRFAFNQWVQAESRKAIIKWYSA